MVMQQDTKKLIETIKEVMKERGFIYRDLCGIVNLSEPSIKRLFSKMNFSLDQIIRISDAIGLTMEQLTNLAFQNQSRFHQYTPQQDLLLGENPLEAYVYVRLLVGYKPNDIKKELDLTDAKMMKVLNRLDDVQLIELLPRGRVKMRVKGPFRHIKNGSFEKVFFPRVLKISFNHFMQHMDLPSNFSGLVHSREYYLTRPAYLEFRKEIEELSRKYREITNWQILQNRPQDLLPVTGLFCLDEFNHFKANIHFKG